MLPRSSSYKNIIFLVLLVGVILLTMRFTQMGRATLTPLAAALRDTVSPVQSLLMRIGESFNHGVGSVSSLGKLDVENKKLREQVDQLKGQLTQQEELKQENNRLRDLLQYHDKYQKNFSTTVARVIGRDPGNWFGMITLNKGSGDGIVKNMPVVTSSGLAGKVVSVSTSTSQVLLITDPRSGVGAMVQDSRVPGVIEGTTSGSGETRLIHVPKDVNLEKGQVIITSGMGGTFPKGLPIGRILSVSDEPTGLFKTATVAPFADLNRLEETLIITNVINPDVSAPAGGS